MTPSDLWHTKKAEVEDNTQPIIPARPGPNRRNKEGRSAHQLRWNTREYYKSFERLPICCLRQIVCTGRPTLALPPTDRREPCLSSRPASCNGPAVRRELCISQKKEEEKEHIIRHNFFLKIKAFIYYLIIYRERRGWVARRYRNSIRPRAVYASASVGRPCQLLWGPSTSNEKPCGQKMGFI